MNLGAFSVSLAVKDLEGSRKFYEKFGFIATDGGRVSLIGLVRSPEQKMKIEAIAKSVAGKDKVHSLIHMAEAKDPAEANARDQQNRGRDVFEKFNDRASETKAPAHWGS